MRARPLRLCSSALQVMRRTLDNIYVLLKSTKIRTSWSERSLLKNLGQTRAACRALAALAARLSRPCGPLTRYPPPAPPARALTPACPPAAPQARGWAC